MQSFFTITDEALLYLKKKDKKLGVAIDKIGVIQRAVNPDLFSALIRSIVGQQISTKAQTTVWNRITNALGEVTPQNIHHVDRDQLKSFGLSYRKVDYIKDFGTKVYLKQFDLEALINMSDEEVCKELSSLKGIGNWTAEMLMLFSMQRENILSFGDLAIIRGMCKLYGHKEMPKERFEKYRKRYTPYGSVASLYLWKISHEDYS
ncbi:DNA-3-methyladenine glycosylase family protein [Flammeovirga pacifica]|uniref:DNA-3-methyladenine glycosylase II n=1 Tax=Flammeovirga pacifica TaxID=915059 RepID=A0A1S1YT06_FLAPC|nr:DNA-3-methyladenine glycosylase [Flammeovirga pacifica]OHX63993.1 DNA-3-methyladenine glycosidase [Flammeovirga pacifica]